MGYFLPFTNEKPGRFVKTKMDQILLIRENTIFFYRRYETFINYILRFFAGLIILNIINSIGCYNEMFASLYEGPMAFPFLMLMSVLFMILPPTIANAMLAINMVLQISVSLEVSVFAFLMFILVLVFYSRLAPKKSFLIVAMILGFYFRIPYAVVLFAGLYCGLTSIIPITIGTYIWGLVPLFSNLVSQATAFSLDKIDIMETFNGFLETYKLIFEGLAKSFDALFTAFIFAMIIIAVYAVSRLAIDFSKEVAVGIGALIGVLGFVIGSIIINLNYSILSVFAFSLLSVVLVEIIRFFDIVLDYSKAERVEFQDDDNYYYVKVIPKVIMNKQAAEPKTKERRHEPSKTAPRMPVNDFSKEQMLRHPDKPDIDDSRRRARGFELGGGTPSKPTLNPLYDDLKTEKPVDKPASKAFMELSNLSELSKRVEMQQEALRKERERKMRELIDSDPARDTKD